MLFDVLTGILSAVFLALSLLYPLRRRWKRLGKAGRLTFHCIAGCLLLLATLIHVNVKLAAPGFSFGFAAFAALLLTAVTGVLKRRNMKSKPLYYAHVLFVVLFIVAFLLHVAQQIINLLIM